MTDIPITKPIRGALTPEAAAIYLDGTGRELNITELRLLPYLADRLLNRSVVDLRRVNQAEIEIIEDLIESGHLVLIPGLYDDEGFSPAITPAYWHTITQVLLLTYVTHTETDAQ